MLWTFRQLTWASSVRHLAQAQLVDASHPVAVIKQSKFYWTKLCVIVATKI